MLREADLILENQRDMSARLNGTGSSTSCRTGVSQSRDYPGRQRKLPPGYKRKRNPSAYYGIKILPRLYFAGEVIDVDGDCGGIISVGLVSGFVAGWSAAQIGGNKLGDMSLFGQVAGNGCVPHFL